MTHQEFVGFAQFLERQCGILLSEKKSYLVKSRLMPLIRELDLGDLSSCLKLVQSHNNKGLRERVIDAMTTNETLWFRDKYPFTILSQTLLEKFATANCKIRIWSAACSSGQEPYSIAMLVHEYKQKNPRAFAGGVEIFGTDISSDMLSRAKQGSYDVLSIGRGLPDDKKSRYFKTAANNHMQLIPEITSMVSFKPLNLLDSYASLGKFDVIFCRNVLIYFSPQNKRKILQQIAACLQNDGALFLGASESIADLNQLFEIVRNNPGLYYTKKSI